MAKSILERLDDTINPIVVKELRQAVKSRLVVSALLFFLLLQLVILGIFVLFREINAPGSPDYQAGQAIFLTLQGILLGLCLFLVPGYAGVRLAAERSDTNVDLLFISTLKPHSIIWGKFLAAAVLVLLIFSACAPFMTFTYLLRGLDIPTILLVLAMDFIIVMAATMLALFLASVPTTRAMKGGLIPLAFVGICLLLNLGMWASVALVMERNFAFDSEQFWITAGAFTLVILTEMGQYFVWSVALISPPSANRALLVRLYTAARWLVCGVAALWIAYLVKHPAPIYIWQVIVLGLFCVQLTISICEREQLGPRVARTIPRSRLLRALALLIYSGAAGGILFCVLMEVLTLTLGLLAVQWVEYLFAVAATNATHMTFVMSLVALYAYSYALLAVLCRRVLLRRYLRPSFTYLVLLILLAVGCILPYVVLLVFHTDAPMLEREHTWIFLSNPIAAIITAAEPTRFGAMRDFDTLCLLFVSCWAGLMTILNMRWLIRQIQAFRPLPLKADRVAAPTGTPAPRMAGVLNNGQEPPGPEAVVPPGPVAQARRSGLR
jgi:hypothetical protein